MLYEESAAFAHDDDDIGCIPSLQMAITLKDDIPVQRTYTSVPKPLYQEVKEYIQDLLARGWIVKSKSPYSAPVVSVRKKKMVHLDFPLTIVHLIRRQYQTDTLCLVYKT